MRKVEALTASLVLLLVLSATARLALAQGPDGGGDRGDRNREDRNDNRRDGNNEDGGPSSRTQEATTSSTNERTKESTKEYSKGKIKGIPPVPADDLTVKLKIKGVKVLECPDCGENAVASVGKVEIDYFAGTTATVLSSCFDTEEQMGGIWIDADLKLKSDSKFTQGNVDVIARTFDCCNPISLQYGPLAEDACDVLSDVGGPKNHKCFNGAGCHKAWGGPRPTSSKVCLKANTLTKKNLNTLLIGVPDAIGLHTGCKQTEILFANGNTNEVIGCLRVQWSVCVDPDCGGSDYCGCGDGSVFSNPRCGKCLQTRAERLGICADFFNFAQAPADTCEWRECCCDGDGVTGDTPCSTGNVGSCDDKSCRRHH